MLTSHTSVGGTVAMVDLAMLEKQQLGCSSRHSGSGHISCSGGTRAKASATLALISLQHLLTAHCGPMPVQAQHDPEASCQSPYMCVHHQQDGAHCQQPLQHVSWPARQHRASSSSSRLQQHSLRARHAQGAATNRPYQQSLHPHGAKTNSSAAAQPHPDPNGTQCGPHELG